MRKQFQALKRKLALKAKQRYVITNPATHNRLCAKEDQPCPSCSFRRSLR